MAKLNDWINRVVTEISEGIGTDPDDDQGGKDPSSPRNPLPHAPVGKIQISIDSNTAGTKVPLAFSIYFFGLDGGTRVRPVAVTWRSTEATVADFSSVTGMINTYSPGATLISCETAAGVTSNQVPLDVIDCDKVTLDAAAFDLAVGRRRRIRATGYTSDGKEHAGVRLYWSADSDAVQVGPGGMVTGVAEGTAVVTGKEGDGTSATCVVTVVPAEHGPGGPSRPKYLLSEVQTAPYDSEPPIFHKDEGLVVQRQRDIEHNVWWINRAGRLARFIATERGETSEEWFLYLGERIADAAIEAALLGADRGTEARPVSEVMEEIANYRGEILDSFMEEFGSTNQLVI